MLRLPLISGFRRLIPRAGVRRFQNRPSSANTWTKLAHKSSPTAVSQGMGQVHLSIDTIECLKEPPALVGEDTVMVDISNYISNDRKKQHLENKDTNAESRENQLPNLQVTKVFDVEIPYNPYEGHPTAWQLGEDINEFLVRCVPSQTKAMLGPWIWIANPHSGRGIQGDHMSLVTLLQEHLANAKRELARIISDGSLDKAAKVIAKKQNSDSLKQVILRSATLANVTFGKWMLFPKWTFADKAWSIVARATLAGDLGVCAKSAINDGNGNPPVICVYTRNFADTEDVERVLLKLNELGFNKGISYKPDVYTYLGLGQGNEYQIGPSIYSSNDFLGKE